MSLVDEEPFRSKLKADFREEKSRLRSLKTDQELQKQAEQEAEEQRKREALQQEAAARERDVEVQKEKEKKDADELAKWLADNGFSEKNHRKRKCCSVQYPLHAAVADKSPPMDTDVVQVSFSWHCFLLAGTRRQHVVSFGVASSKFVCVALTQRRSKTGPDWVHEALKGERRNELRRQKPDTPASDSIFMRNPLTGRCGCCFFCCVSFGQI